MGDNFGLDQINTIEDIKNLLAGGAILGFSAFILIVAVIAVAFSCWVTISASKAAIFQKADKNPWASFIPFYGDYVFFDLAMKMPWLGVVYSSVGLFSWFNSNLAFVIYIATLIISIVAKYNLSKRFGKGFGFALGLIFLPIVFYPILAFDSSEYKSTDSKDDVKN